ncbi:MAG: hypothetical protein JWM47_4388 [Acidimicrobiales bacterium]|nr:hypothetical protein [Acidimicrobiales bacterium]
MGIRVLTWGGRIFLLAIPYVFVCNLLFPAGIAPASALVCPQGTTIETRSRQLDRARDLTSRYAVICTSETRLAVRTHLLIGETAILFPLAVGAYLLRNRITPRELSAPGGPATMRPAAV